MAGDAVCDTPTSRSVLPVRGVHCPVVVEAASDHPTEPIKDVADGGPAVAAEAEQGADLDLMVLMGLQKLWPRR
jgi:hypothetical protein